MGRQRLELERRGEPLLCGGSLCARERIPHGADAAAEQKQELGLALLVGVRCACYRLKEQALGESSAEDAQKEQALG